MFAEPITIELEGYVDMTIRIVRLGSDREPGEGLRLGTVRRPPRGVPKAEYSARNLYDVWFPNLSPSEALLKEFFPIADDRHWKTFERRFVAEMKASAPFPAAPAAAAARRRAVLSRSLPFRATGDCMSRQMPR